MSGTKASSEQRLALPTQSAPTHDRLTDPGFPVVAHWAEHTPPRYVAPVVLALAAAGLVTCAAVAAITGSLAVTIGVGIAALGMIVLRIATMSADRTTVDLHASLLTVEHDGAVHVVDLANAETSGDPHDEGWRFRASTRDGQLLELGPREVDPVALDAAVRHWRRVRRPRSRARAGA